MNNMLKFDKEGMADVELLKKEEALVFGLFLYSEMLRHKVDIDMILKKIKHLDKKFDLDIIDEYRTREDINLSPEERTFK